MSIVPRDFDARPASQPWLLTAVCLVLGVLFSLQQWVLLPMFGVGLSVGTLTMVLFELLTALAMLHRHGLPRIMRPTLVAMLWLVVVFVVSALHSAHMAIALRFTVRYVIELGLLWCCLNLALASPRVVAAAVRAAVYFLWGNLLLGCAVRAGSPLALRLSLYFHPEETFTKYLPRMSGVFEHPALLGATGVMVAFVAIQSYRQRMLPRAYVLAAGIGAVLAVFLAEQRNPLLPVLALLAWQLWRTRDTALRVPLRTLLLVALAGLLWIIHARYGELSSAWSEGGLTAFTLGRTYLWQGAFAAWRDHVWLGLGPGVFQYLVPDFTGGRFDRGELHAHNVVLAALSETGMAGLMALFGLLHALWHPLLRRVTASSREWGWRSLILLAAFGLFDTYLPFYGFALAVALVLAVQYARVPPGLNS